MSRVELVDLPTDPAGPRGPQPPGLPLVDSPASPGRPRLRRLGLRSLTGRLVSGVVFLVLVVVGVVGAGTYVELRHTLDNRLDQQVSAAADRAANYFSQCSPRPSGLFCPKFQGPTSGGEWFAILSPNGSTQFRIRGFSGVPNVYQLQLTGAQRLAFANSLGSYMTVRSGSHAVRASAQPTQLGFVVVAGLSTGDRDVTLSRLLALEIVIGGAAVLVALVATLLGVRLTMRGLRAVTNTAQDVASELSPEGRGLDRRVHDADDTTEVGQLATSFNMMLGAVETQFAARVDSEQRMRQFLADASHELRTPLTSIRGYAELARMQRAASNPVDDRAHGTTDDNLDRIEAEGTRMSRLVEDLLTLARDDTAADREPRRELIDVAELLDDAVSGSRAAFPARRFDSHTSGDPFVLGDRDQLLRVVRNLVTNAAIHTDPQRPIMVQSWNDGTNVVTQVIDGGPGLPPEEAAHVFERFWRADKARTRARGGSGLGMAIVASIVRGHGGTVRFDSSVESGSTVTVTLPAVASQSG